MLPFLAIVLTLTFCCCILTKNQKYCKTKGELIMFTDLIRKVQSDPNADPEQVANEILQLAGYAEFSQAVPVVEIAVAMGFFIKTINELPNRDRGYILVSALLREKLGTCKGIVLSEQNKYGKNRFVLAHELGHYLFDFNEQTSADFSHIFTEAYNKNSQDDPNEKRVNKFAACLLMPRKNFTHSFKKLRENIDFSLADIIAILADDYEVTQKAAKLRIEELRLV